MDLQRHLPSDRCPFSLVHPRERNGRCPHYHSQAKTSNSLILSPPLCFDMEHVAISRARLRLGPKCNPHTQSDALPLGSVLKCTCYKLLRVGIASIVPGTRCCSFWSEYQCSFTVAINLPRASGVRSGSIPWPRFAMCLPGPNFAIIKRVSRLISSPYKITGSRLPCKTFDGQD